jgi:hypothetical protein
MIPARRNSIAAASERNCMGVLILIGFLYTLSPGYFNRSFLLQYVYRIHRARSSMNLRVPFPMPVA